MFNKFFKKKYNNLFIDDILSDQHHTNFFDDNLFEGRENIFIGKTSYLSILFFCILTMAFSGTFIYKIFRLQVLENEKYGLVAYKNQFTVVPILSVRGSILDRNDEVLAHTQKTGSSSKEFDRLYIEESGFGNILGYVSPPKKDKKGIYYQENFQGVEGIEKYYDKTLSGKPGNMYFEKTAEGELTNARYREEPIHGKNIKLSIDKDLQKAGYKYIEQFVKVNGYNAGAGVIMDVNSGEVIFLGTYPTYDPGKIVGGEKAKNSSTATDYYKNISENKKKPFLNRAVAGLYAPGSIVKPLFALAALQEGVITPATSIFSAGRIIVKSQVTGGKDAIFKDWKAHGWTDLREAIAVSSDVYFYSVVGGYEQQKGIGIKKLDFYSSAFGLDKNTNIDIFNEAPGNIPTPEWKKKVFKEDWRLGDTYNSSIGQYGFLVTPVSIARYAAAIANRGKLITPKMLYQENADKSFVKDVSIKIDEENYKTVEDGMRLAVTNGTAEELYLPYVKIAAKTGTAEVGAKKEKINSWVMGYFPYKEPKYAFAFVLENGNPRTKQTATHLTKEIIEWLKINKPEYLGQFTLDYIKNNGSNSEENSSSSSILIMPATSTIQNEVIPTNIQTGGETSNRAE